MFYLFIYVCVYVYAVVFDHRVWNFGAIAWADVTFLATEVLATL